MTRSIIKEIVDHYGRGLSLFFAILSFGSIYFIYIFGFLAGFPKGSRSMLGFDYFYGIFFELTVALAISGFLHDIFLLV